MHIILFIVVIALFTSFGIAQEKTDVMIFGDVKSAVSKEHIPYANIIVKGTKIGTAADKTGHFKLIDLPVGNITITAKAVGYKEQELFVNTEPGKAINLFFELEEDILELDRVVVTGNRIEESRRESPVIVGLITPKTFEITNSLNLADGFSFQPGLRLENNCQNCGFQQVRINGLDGPYSQILIDGKPIFSSLNSVYGIEQIPANMIDRVEVVRGGGSALYGSNAIGGTINVLTKIPLNNSFQIKNNTSFFNSKTMDRITTLNASLLDDDLKTGIAIFGSLRDRDYFDQDGDGFSEIPKLNSQTLGFKSFYRFSDNQKLNFEYHHLKEFRRGGNKFDLQPHETDITEQIEHLINSGALEYLLLKDQFQVSSYLSIQTVDRNSYYGAGQDPNAYGITNDKTFAGGIQYSTNFDNLIFSPSSFTTGAEYSQNQLNDKMPGYGRRIDQKASVFGFYIQNQWDFSIAKFLLGARIDKHNLLKNIVVVPRATFLFNISEQIQSRFSFARGYRAPQAFDEDLHIIAVGGKVVLIRPAENLKPENSTSYTGSIDIYHNFGSVQTNFLAEAFYTDLSDAFALESAGTDPNGNLILERINASGAKVYGINFQGVIAPSSSIKFQMGLTIQKSEYKEAIQWSEDADVEPTKFFNKSPDSYGYFTSTFDLLKNISFSLTGVYTGSMYIQHFAGYIPKDKLEKSKSFFELNTKLSYTIPVSSSLGLQLNAGVQNLLNSFQSDFDKGPDRDSGYIYGPTRPRTIFLGIGIENGMF